VGELNVVTKRVFDAPREAVWNSFEDPARLARWFGPNGFTNKFSTFEFKSGGKTELTWNAVIQTDGGEKFEAFIREKNEENFDRLAASLREHRP
jgi:uncharacterized protein YndB with AHSA1/START domain